MKVKVDVMLMWAFIHKNGKEIRGKSMEVLYKIMRFYDFTFDSLDKLLSSTLNLLICTYTHLHPHPPTHTHTHTHTLLRPSPHYSLPLHKHVHKELEPYTTMTEEQNTNHTHTILLNKTTTEHWTPTTTRENRTIHSNTSKQLNTSPYKALQDGTGIHNIHHEIIINEV